MYKTNKETKKSNSKIKKKEKQTNKKKQKKQRHLYTDSIYINLDLKDNLYHTK